MRSIIVPLDGSGFAEQALPAAIDIAARTGATVNVVGVHGGAMAAGAPAAAPFFGQEFENAQRAEVERYLTETAERLRATGAGVPAAATLLEGRPGDAIAAYADRHAPSLIVLTTHGRRGPSRLWIGSVAADVARRARAPMISIRTADEPAAPRASGVYRRVLIALDGSAASEAAIEPAIAVGGHTHVEYVLLRVVPRLHRYQRLAAYEAAYTRELEAHEGQARSYLAEVAARPVFAGASVVTAVRVHEHEATAILECAAEVRADLIAAGTHSRTAVERLFLGSVADALLRSAAVPVLLVRG